MKNKRVLILGFASNVPMKNKIIAFFAGFFLALRGYDLVTGNITGTFYFALLGASMANGNTKAFIDNKISTSPFFINETTYVKTKALKHQQLIINSDIGLVIGGGKYSKRLIEQFKQLNKSIVAIENTHGVVTTEIEEFNVKAFPLLTALKWITTLD